MNTYLVHYSDGTVDTVDADDSTFKLLQKETSGTGTSFIKFDGVLDDWNFDQRYLFAPLKK